MYFIFTILSFLSIETSWAQSGLDACEVVDLVICRPGSSKSSRSSLKSIPSLSASSMMNPAAVSFNKGLGIELIYQPSNPLAIGLSSGTGRMGGALVSNSHENTFFGNHTYESESDLIDRINEKKQFKAKKIAGAVGVSLLDSRFLEVDIGLMLKRHKEIKKINTGLGLSGRLWVFTYGFASYKDDASFRFMNDEDVVVEYNVKTYSVGTQIGRMTFDAGVIETKYSDFYTSKINLYSTSYSLGRFLFNYAYKVKNYVPIGANEYHKEKSMFGGIQIALGKHLITGLNYNYYDLDEFSLSMNLFF